MSLRARFALGAALVGVLALLSALWGRIGREEDRPEDAGLSSGDGARTPVSRGGLASRGHPEPGPPPTGAVVVRFVDGSGAALKGETAVLRGAGGEEFRAVVGDDGSARFAGVQLSQTYASGVRLANGQLALAGDVSVPAKPSAEVRTMRVARSTALRGRVLTTEGAPVPGADVLLVRSRAEIRYQWLFARPNMAAAVLQLLDDMSSAARARTGDDGGFEFERVPPADYRIVARTSDGVGETRVSVGVGAPPRDVRVVTAASRASEPGLLTDATGAPIAGALVLRFAATESYAGSMDDGRLDGDYLDEALVQVTDERGRFAFPTVDRDSQWTYAFLVRAPRIPVAYWPNVQHELDHSVRLRLPGPAPFVLRVLDDGTGKPLDAVTTLELSDGKSGRPVTLVTPVTGGITELPAGGRVESVLVRASGYDTADAYGPAKVAADEHLRLDGGDWDGSIAAGATRTLWVRLRRGLRLEGTVRDTAGRPIPAAVVSDEESGPRATADGQGRFAVDGWDRAAPSVRVSCEGWRRQTQAIDFGPDEGRSAASARVDVVLRRPAAVTGSVVTDDGQPVPEASVRLDRLSDGHGESPRVATGPSGGFLFVDDSDADPELDRDGRRMPLRYQLYVDAESFMRQGTEPFEVRDGDTKEVSVVLRRGASIRGVVTARRGEPLPNARVEFDADVRSVETGSRGDFQIDGVPEGTHRVWAVTQQGARSAVASLEVTPTTKTATLDLVADADQVVMVRVVDSEGVAVRVASVVEQWSGRYELPYQWRIPRDAENTYHVTGVPREGVTISVEAEGYAPKTLHASPSEPEVTIVLEKQAR